MMAPIVPHMAEDAWQNLPYTEKPTKFSVFDKGWITESGRFPSFEAKKWDRVRALRGDVNGCIGQYNSLILSFHALSSLFYLST